MGWPAALEAKLFKLKTRRSFMNIPIPLRVLTWLSPFVLVCALTAGCGAPKEEVYRVHGKVTFKGKPVPKGNVFFDPDGSKGTSGKQGFAGIVDGQYDTALPDGDGVKKGDYTVRVQAFDGKPLPDLPFGTGLTAEFVTKKNFSAEDNEFDIAIEQ